MTRLNNKKLHKEFEGKPFFTREELFDFFLRDEPDLKKNTFAWRIHNLQNNQIIKSIKRGVYQISSKPNYEPDISGSMLKLGRLLNAEFEGVNYCLWESGWLNEFSQHQSSKNMLLVEVEKDVASSVYYAFRDAIRNSTYLLPDEKTIHIYIAESDKPVVIKNLITRSPLKQRIVKKNSIRIPALEKILVDIFADQALFYFSQGAELVHIFENALQTYAINYTSMLNYAQRRGREQALKLFLKENIAYLIKDTIDD